MDAGSRAPQEFLGLPSPATIGIREEGPRPWAGRRADGGRGRRKGKGASRNLRRGRACGEKERRVRCAPPRVPRGANGAADRARPLQPRRLPARSARWRLARARAAAAGGASKRRGRARRREGEIWAPALAPAAQDADALGEKKRREEREKKGKREGVRTAGAAASRAGGMRGSGWSR